MNPFVAGEADAYAKRNAGHSVVEPWFLGLLQTISFRSVLDMGGGDGQRVDAIRHGIAGVTRLTSVDAKSGESFDSDDLQMIYGQDVEQYVGPDVDLTMFCYCLHWLPHPYEMLDRAMQASRHVLINDFYPSHPIDVPYAHRPGIVTQKRRYGLHLAEAGWKLHAAVKYRYKGEPDGEWCRAEIWSKPC
jgi:hypothetical protein